MRRVTAPDGTEHTVRIDWVGNRARRTAESLPGRFRRGARRAGDMDPLDGLAFVDDFGGLVIGVVVALVVVLAIVLIPGVALGLVQFLLLAAVGLAVWGFRVAFRRPWLVRHLAGEQPVSEVSVVGWRRAHRVMVEAAEEVERTGSAALAFAPHGTRLG